MKKKREKKSARGAQDWTLNLDVVHPNAAGIDIGNESHYVAVPPDRDAEPIRQFACFTEDLRRLAGWLKSCGIDTVAMQSTGVYWLPAYEILVEQGLEVFLVNARHTKNLPGRKTDVQECQWLLQLHTFGLLNNSSAGDIPFRLVVGERCCSSPRIEKYAIRFASEGILADHLQPTRNRGESPRKMRAMFSAF